MWNLLTSVNLGVNKTASYFTSKNDLFGHNEELHFDTCNYGWTTYKFWNQGSLSLTTDCYCHSGLLGTGPHSRRWTVSEQADSSYVFTATPHCSPYHLSCFLIRLISGGPIISVMCLIHPEIIPLSVKKLSSMKLGPSTKKVRDCCYKGKEYKFWKRKCSFVEGERKVGKG